MEVITDWNSATCDLKTGERADRLQFTAPAIHIWKYGSGILPSVGEKGHLICKRLIHAGRPGAAGRRVALWGSVSTALTTSSSSSGCVSCPRVFPRLTPPCSHTVRPVSRTTAGCRGNPGEPESDPSLPCREIRPLTHPFLLHQPPLGLTPGSSARPQAKSSPSPRGPFPGAKHGGEREPRWGAEPGRPRDLTPCQPSLAYTGCPSPWRRAR